MPGHSAKHFNTKLEPYTDSLWEALLGQPAKHFNTKLVLYTDNLKDSYVIPLKMESRPDVTEHFNDGNKYDACGFSAKIDSDFLGDQTWKAVLLYADYDKIWILPTNVTYSFEQGE